MDLSLLSYLHRAQLKLDPFPHYIINNVFPESTYSQLDSTYPESIMLSDKNNIVNDRGHTKRLLRRSFDDVKGFTTFGTPLQRLIAALIFLMQWLIFFLHLLLIAYIHR